MNETEQLKHDLEFIARMLREVIVNKDKRDDFHICEAWAVAKKYAYPQPKSNGTHG
jgi:hypothetical protein